MLERENDKLQLFLEYLCAVHALPVKYSRMKLRHESQQDLANRGNPRAFCYVLETKPTLIYTSQYISCIPDHFLLGILYHEIGHHVTHTWNGGDEDEPKCDLWCLEFAPELNYGYAAACKYTRPGSTNKVTAENLQFINLYPIGRFFGKRGSGW